MPEIEKTCAKKFLLKKKKHLKNIVNDIYEEILKFFSDVFFLRRFGEDLKITLI